MQTTRQLSIFLPNTQGSLKQVLDVFKKEGIQLIATTVADTIDFGVFRVICDNPAKAYEALAKEGMTVSQSDVFAVELKDTPGMAADAISIITNAGINLSYFYSFVFEGRGMLIFKTDNVAKASEVISSAGFQTRSL